VADVVSNSVFERQIGELFKEQAVIGFVGGVWAGESSRIDAGSSASASTSRPLSSASTQRPRWIACCEAFRARVGFQMIAVFDDFDGVW